MSIIIRQLGKDEYDKLEGHEFLKQSGVPPPAFSEILVAEDGGKIVGFYMLIQVPHLEPIWVDPEYRGSMLPARLWKAMRRLLDALQLTHACAFAEDIKVAGYLQRLGMTELPYRTFLYSSQK